MKYYTFYRENNNFTDILNDPVLKKNIDTKISWYQHLIIGVNDKTEQTQSLITLKYGDEMVTSLVRDFSPKPGVDYIPKKDPSTFKKSMS